MTKFVFFNLLLLSLLSFFFHQTMLAFSQKIAKLVPQSLSSTPKILKRNMQIRSIPMRWGTGDNYAYLLTDDATKNSWVIDPAEPDE